MYSHCGSPSSLNVVLGLSEYSFMRGMQAGLTTAGVRWSSYGENPHLQEFFKVLSLSADRDERIYVSTMEAHKVTFCYYESLQFAKIVA